MAQFPEGLVTISKPNSDLGKQVFFSVSFVKGGSSHLGIYFYRLQDKHRGTHSVRFDACEIAIFHHPIFLALCTAGETSGLLIERVDKHRKSHHFCSLSLERKHTTRAILEVTSHQIEWKMSKDPALPHSWDPPIV